MQTTSTSEARADKAHKEYASYVASRADRKPETDCHAARLEKPRQPSGVEEKGKIPISKGETVTEDETAGKMSLCFREKFSRMANS